MDMVLGLNVNSKLHVVSLFSATYIVIEAIPMCIYNICLSNN